MYDGLLTSTFQTRSFHPLEIASKQLSCGEGPFPCLSSPATQGASDSVWAVVVYVLTQ